MIITLFNSLARDLFSCLLHRQKMLIRIRQNKFLVFNNFGTCIRRAADQKTMGINNLILDGDALFSSDRIAITTSAKQTPSVYVASTLSYVAIKF